MAPKKKSLGAQKTTEMKAHGSQKNRDGSEFSLDFKGTMLCITIARKSEEVASWIINAKKKNNRFLESETLLVGMSFGGDEATVSTITLSSGRNCLIIPRRFWEEAPFKQILKNFFADDEITFVGIAVGPHQRILRRSGINFHRMIDLKGRLCKKDEELSCKDMLVRGGIAFDFDLNTQVTRGDWGKKKLSKAQIRQTVGDSYVSRRIGVNLLKNGKLMEDLQGRLL